ncbi:uncharacterized protein LOC111406718 [Olea europaea var. sylvestris]|uniref:uncharacterized protein LOC111406718 n=1 Tax=Olea europaea var. sylvestris TaxID=158386 RepID=UPI000C1D4FAF|nr:uncharacterized protein LOC111406718 [Olea europaea var. sylvestris]
MEREFGVKISYSKAHRGKLHALNMLHGTPRDSFQKLSSYCHVVGESNPRTVTHIEVDSYNRFRYFFVAFGASIRGYMQYLRPVICVDGSHLKGPYKGTLLVATTQDGNKQIYPLTWEIVDAETNKSWKWFLSNLKDLIGDSEELVFVSDRKKSIQKAISQLFPSSRHGCCIWVEDFERLMGQICRVSERAHGYLERAGYSFWSRALFIGHRYNIMTNNNAESLNSMLREARGKTLYELCSRYYSSDYWKGAYNETIYPVPREVDWVVPSLITCTPIFLPLVRRPLGRPPTRRKRSRCEYAWSTRKYTRCGRVGHNRTTCLNPRVSHTP